jgi:hypothetical protein
LPALAVDTKKVKKVKKSKNKNKNFFLKKMSEKSFRLDPLDASCLSEKK